MAGLQASHSTACPRRQPLCSNVPVPMHCAQACVRVLRRLVCWRCCCLQASAIGKNMTNAKTFLEKRYNDEMGLEDAVHTSLLTLKEGFEGQVSGSNIEVRGGGDRVVGCRSFSWCGFVWTTGRSQVVLRAHGHRSLVPACTPPLSPRVTDAAHLSVRHACAHRSASSGLTRSSRS